MDFPPGSMAIRPPELYIDRMALTTSAGASATPARLKRWIMMLDWFAVGPGLVANDNAMFPASSVAIELGPASLSGASDATMISGPMGIPPVLNRLIAIVRGAPSEAERE
ncbi:hypothetical protein GmRootV59_57930 (plasmid) [Variovorax sp. V59]